MSPEIIVLLAVILLILLLSFEVPVALALGLSGATGIYLLDGFRAMQSTLAAVPYSATSQYSLVVIPMFILMGTLAVHGRIAEQVFAVAQHHLRRLPGGLGLATVSACAGFAAVTGSSVATAATFGRLSVDEMCKHGYSPSFAAGIVASAGTLGALIPPSILLVFYGILTGESIGVLLIAGIIPGILSAVIYGAYVIYKGRKIVPAMTDAPSINSKSEDQNPKNQLERKRTRPPYRGVVRVAILFTVVVGGIYTGTFTASESASIAAMLAAGMLCLELRREGAGVIWQRVRSALTECASTSSMVFLILVGAGIFSYMLVSAGIPAQFTAWATELPVPPWAIVALILILLIPLGMALDSFSIMAITVPLAYPVVTGLGFDGIWFGILVVKMAELGLITPPVGVNAYIVAGSAKGVSAETVFRGIAPFTVLDAFTVVMIFLIPAIVTWLPSQAGI